MHILLWPEVPTPYLGFFWRVTSFILSILKPKKESKKAAEIRRAREEFKRPRKVELERRREGGEMIEKAIKMQKKEEEKRRKMDIRQRKYDKAMENARMKNDDMSYVWINLVQDSYVLTALVLVLFMIFYRTVVLRYKKQKKDYEGRLKIEKAEAEERKKMRQLEGSWMGFELMMLIMLMILSRSYGKKARLIHI